MKNTILIYLLVIIGIHSHAQTMSDLVNKSDAKVTWLGIDYSHVVLIGDFNQFNEAGATGPDLIKDKYFPAWNDLMIKEYKKYDLKGAFRKDTVFYKNAAITALNKDVKADNLPATEAPKYTSDQIKTFIKKYNYNVNDGIGILLVAEYLNKTEEKAKYHLVILNMASKEVLKIEAFEGKAGGFGLRNYWAKSYLEVIMQIKDKQFKVWKKELEVK